MFQGVSGSAVDGHGAHRGGGDVSVVVVDGGGQGHGHLLLRRLPELCPPCATQFVSPGSSRPAGGAARH